MFREADFLCVITLIKLFFFNGGTADEISMPTCPIFNLCHASMPLLKEFGLSIAFVGERTLLLFKLGQAAEFMESFGPTRAFIISHLQRCFQLSNIRL